MNSINNTNIIYNINNVYQRVSRLGKIISHFSTIWRISTISVYCCDCKTVSKFFFGWKDRWCQTWLIHQSQKLAPKMCNRGTWVCNKNRYMIIYSSTRNTWTMNSFNLYENIFISLLPTRVTAAQNQHATADQCLW